MLSIGFQVKRNMFLEDSEIKYEFESVWRHSEVPSKLILKSIILAVATAHDGNLVNVMIDENSLKTVTQQLGVLEGPTATSKRPPESSSRRQLMASVSSGPMTPSVASEPLEPAPKEVPKETRNQEPPKKSTTNLMSSAPLSQPRNVVASTGRPSSGLPVKKTTTSTASTQARPPSPVKENVVLKPTGNRAALVASVSTPAPTVTAATFEPTFPSETDETEKSSDDLFNDLESELENLKF